MDAVTVVLIAVGLAMDAFAVSIANGMTTTTNRKRYALLTAGFFGGFQMLMPLIGWFAGLSLESVIAGVDHWVAFGLLSFIGAKMIYDGAKKEPEQKNVNGVRLHSLLILAIATSIDALMVGFTFAFLQTAIVLPIVAIGVITFSLSFAGFLFGCGLGRFFGNRIKIVGGLVLIFIGLRILIEHLL